MKNATFIFLLLICNLTFADNVRLRTNGSSINCDVISWSKDGLRIKRNEHSSQEVLPWYNIIDVESNDAGISFGPHLARGEMLWRAKSRLLRGDIALAAPLFQEVFMQLKNHDGPDAHLAAEGLLRCNLAFGKLDATVAPWLCTVKQLQNKRTSQLSTLTPIINDTTFLCEHIPPVWNHERVTRALSSLDIEGEVMMAFHQVIQNPNSTDIQELPGPAFLQQTFILMQPSHLKYENIKKEANALQGLLSWQKAWFIYAEAIALQKGDAKQKQQALLLFAEFISVYGKEQPWLAGESLFLMSEAFANAGDFKLSENIHREFTRTVPYHPLLQQLNRNSKRKE
jgi:hypothetical protein